MKCERQRETVKCGSAGDILRAKRSSLSNIHFEQLVFVRRNMHLLGYKEVQEEEME